LKYGAAAATVAALAAAREIFYTVQDLEITLENQYKSLPATIFVHVQLALGVVHNRNVVLAGFQAG
jgi:4-hydroxybenzoate polyprenyltransferase